MVTEQEHEDLKRRVRNLEILLQDVMQQLCDGRDRNVEDTRAWLHERHGARELYSNSVEI